MPSFIAMFAANLVMYFVVFRPVLEATDNIATDEAVIVATEAVFIKIISKVESFQEEDFKGLKWRTVFICAMAGNLLSYYVGSVIVG